MTGRAAIIWLLVASVSRGAPVPRPKDRRAPLPKPVDHAAKVVGYWESNGNTMWFGKIDPATKRGRYSANWHNTLYVGWWEKTDTGFRLHEQFIMPNGKLSMMHPHDGEFSTHSGRMLIFGNHYTRKRSP